MTRFLLGALGLTLTVSFAHQASVAQDARSLAGFTLGSHRSDLGIENCEPSPYHSAPEGTQALRCVPNDSVVTIFADDVLFSVLLLKQADLAPPEQWQQMRDWAVETFGEPDTVQSGSPFLINIFWETSEARPWKLGISLLARPPGSLCTTELTDCTRARPGYCTNDGGLGGRPSS